MAATRREFLAYVAAAAVAANRPAWAEDIAAPAAAKPDVAGFDQVWDLVRDRFYDPRLHGVDWPAMRDKYRPQAEAARSSADLAGAVNAMLGTLNASHTRYYTRDEPGYYQLADIFAGSLSAAGCNGSFRTARSPIRGSGSSPRPTIWAGCSSPARSRVRRRTRPAFLSATRFFGRRPALCADRLVSRQGRRQSCAVDPANRRGAPMAIAVAPADLKPGEMFLRGLKDSARVIVANGRMRIGYVHVCSDASRRYQGALQELIGEGPLRDADALVWDLRDGWGGAALVSRPLQRPRADDAGGGSRRRDRNRRRQVAQARRRADQRRHAERQGGARLRVQGISARAPDRLRTPRARCWPRRRS